LIRHEEYACRIRVTGIENARLVLFCLSEAFVFRTSQSFQEVEHPASCSFCVAYGGQLTPRELERLLAAIPGVQLQVDRSHEESTIADPMY